MIISTMHAKSTTLRRAVHGKCAKCGADVYESLPELDDCYNVWGGKCPHCAAINMLSVNHGLRGYCSTEMWLVLPTDEERDENHMPKDCPTSGPAKTDKRIHGSNLGELLHQLRGDDA